MVYLSFDLNLTLLYYGFDMIIYHIKENRTGILNRRIVTIKNYNVQNIKMTLNKCMKSKSYNIVKV